MRQIHEADAGFSTLRRWRRARAARAADFPVVAGVDAGVMRPATSRRLLWGLATVGAVAIVAMVSFGVPQVGPGAEATMIGTMSVPEFLKSDTFDRLMRNDAARSVLEKAAADASFRAALTDAGQRNSMTDPAVRQAMTDPAFQTALAWPQLASALADPTFQAALKPRR
jgi:hypothetical protein